MPAIAMLGASLPTFAHHFLRADGVLGMRMNFGMTDSSAPHQSLVPNSSWSHVDADKYGFQSVSSWPFSGNIDGLQYPNNANNLLGVPKGWRVGDWMCNCGFHNYSSRAQVPQIVFI